MSGLKDYIHLNICTILERFSSDKKIIVRNLYELTMAIQNALYNVGMVNCYTLVEKIHKKEDPGSLVPSPILQTQRFHDELRLVIKVILCAMYIIN
jgi:hypothetical protein